MDNNGTGCPNRCPNCECKGRVPRRTVLGWLVGIINAGVMAAIVAPTLGFISAPLKFKKRPGVWVAVLPETELADGETKSINYTLDVDDGYMVSKRTYSVFVQRKGNRVMAYDPTCPHLGCHVEWKERKQRYVCPCHGGTFDDEGNRISGPPPHGLTKITTRIENGQIHLFKG